MQISLRAVLPRPIRRLGRRVIYRLKSNLHKDDCQFDWQKNQWLQLWMTPEIQAKCLEYWKRFRHLDDIRAEVPMSAGTRILDVGCGLSSVLHFLPGRRTGVDPLAKGYQSLYDYPFEVVTAPGESLPWPDGEFDVVFCSCCIDQVTNPDKVIAEIRRVIRPGGHFILTCEVFAEDGGARDAAHPHSITAEKLRDLGEGFSILQSWSSPWYGMRNYALGLAPTAQLEHILLFRKPVEAK